MKIAALVPMRHHSQRVPGKNYRPLAGKPLFHHIIAIPAGLPRDQPGGGRYRQPADHGRAAPGTSPA